MKKPLSGVGVGAVIFDNKNRLFLAKRGPKARSEHGKWECPGGGMEFGESFDHAIKREIMEEFGIEIIPIRPLGVVNHLLLDEDKHWVAIPYLCKIKKGTPKILEPEKCSEIGWFTLDQIVSMSHSVLFGFGLMEILKNYLANEKT